MTACRSLVLAGALALVAVLGSGCSSPDAGARVDPVGPDRAQFGALSRVLVFHCGTLDCHGQPNKNLRLYGYGGLRLPATDGRVFRPDEGGGDARPEEVAANYDSVISLEPEIMRAVVAESGRDPERLSLVRKARGAEGHKGRNPFVVGDDGDTCLTSWLRSSIDTAACNRAVPLPLPDGGL